MKRIVKARILWVMVWVSVTAAGQAWAFNLEIECKPFDQDYMNEWIHFTITDSVTGVVVYDTLHIFHSTQPFHDVVQLDTGIYKGDVVSIGANVYMPVLKVSDVVIPWGYPDYEYFLIKLPFLGDGIDDLDWFAFNAYPNPANDFVEISLDKVYESIEVSIFASDGRKVGETVMKYNDHVRIALTDLTPDVYIVNVNVGHMATAIRLLHQ
ncbi:MAG: T9SS type A sorting domain-containing protein [Flavobacteriales bacterium]|nr:T9SS type A sorting domain-containing protein [Flavobacteriales bacterium]